MDQPDVDRWVIWSGRDPDAILILRLLCDENLSGPARWLRAAGYDTVLAAQGEPDAGLLARCLAEDRVLISRDRRLAQAAESKVRTVLLEGDGADDHALALAKALGLDWTFAPFTRCLLDNEALVLANQSDLARVPPRSRALPGPFRVCPGCGRVYWPGSHVRRMRLKLEEWRDIAFGLEKGSPSRGTEGAGVASDDRGVVRPGAVRPDGRSADLRGPMHGPPAIKDV